MKTLLGREIALLLGMFTTPFWVVAQEQDSAVIDMYTTNDGILNLALPHNLVTKTNNFIFDNEDVTSIVHEWVNTDRISFWITKDGDHNILRFPITLSGTHEVSIKLTDNVTISKKSDLNQHQSLPEVVEDFGVKSDMQSLIVSSSQQPHAISELNEGILQPNSKKIMPKTSNILSILNPFPLKIPLLKTPSPIASFPVNKTSNLSLKDLKFSWEPVAGASNYRLLVSTDYNFSGFDENTSSCDDRCFTITTKATSLLHSELTNYYWTFGQYYFKIRANSKLGASEWSSTSTFTTGDEKHRNLVTKALSYPHGSNAPQSIIVPGALWQTDTADGDGNRMRNSILILDAYVKKEVTRKGAGGFDNFGNTGRSVPIDVKNKMVAAFSGSSYYSRQKDALVAQIIHQYNGSVPENNDNAILSYMGILAQCKEFSDRLVSDSGNHPTVYTKSSVKSSDIIPGYYGFKFDTKNKGSHAFIINAIKWNKNGEVTHYNITESNAADSNWGNNPPGMIPWGRTVSQTKGISEKSYFEVSN